MHEHFSELALLLIIAAACGALALRLRQGSVSLRSIAFGRGDWAEELSQVEGAVDVAYRPVINHFRGRQSVELHLVDWRHAREPAAV